MCKKHNSMICVSHELKALKEYSMISWAGTALLIIGCHYIRSMINSFNWYLISVLNFLSNCNTTQRFNIYHTAHTVDITEHWTVITLFVNHTLSLSLYIYIYIYIYIIARGTLTKADIYLALIICWLIFVFLLYYVFNDNSIMYQEFS